MNTKSLIAVLLPALLATISCTKEKETVVNTFTVGHITLVDTLGPTRPVNVKKASMRRDETIDFIYKIDSALENRLDSIQLFNGYFLIGDQEVVNDSIKQIEILTHTRPDWKRKQSRTKEKRFLVHTLGNKVIRFDYLDNFTVYKLRSSVIHSGSSHVEKEFDQVHAVIDSTRTND